MGRFTGKVALVTGASSGIGRATALRLASEGAAVACVDVVADANEKTAAQIREEGGAASTHACDVRDPEAVGSMLDAIVAEHGQLDVVCNIAGVGKFAHTHEMPVEDWDRIIAVNLTGTFLVCRAAIPKLLDRGGVIVNTASTAGLIAQPYSAAYNASKGGVVLLTKALAWEYVERGIRVNAVAPGGVETPILDHFGFPEGSSKRLFGKIMTPMGYAKPEEIAALFAYIASDEARFMTGSIVSIDGGIAA
jgi:NAD(P)-dependent dehydrogenase (short-subunit alcohol dehydrogenase family)